MKHTKVSTIILAASICCTQIFLLQAVDWKKTLAAVALVGSCHKIATDPSFIPMGGNNTRAFADSLVSCSLAQFGAQTGMQVGDHVTSSNTAGTCAGLVSGGALGAITAIKVGGSSYFAIKYEPQANLVMTTLGCFCGHALGGYTAMSTFYN